MNPLLISWIKSEFTFFISEITISPLSLSLTYYLFKLCYANSLRMHYLFHEFTIKLLFANVLSIQCLLRELTID